VLYLVALSVASCDVCADVLYVRVIFCCWASPTHTSHLATGHHFWVSCVRSAVAAL
jgi:hypothetical protein